MFRSRSWFGGGWNRPKNRLSLDHLKYLYSVLERNTTVSESNRGLLVESLRSIAEILIWGDQHDSSVFDFFLEKNMLSYFLHIMRQRSGGASFVCVQLLQTLNILFENIRNETSLYYLLSNNHVNSIIVHKFDFSDEDVMGYYILFLKTLSLKLNTHTIHFFYNEHTNDFPLYTEAIKFFNHPESMVRIAVRTISLNVYKVENTSMLQFIRDKTAAPYFSNLVWFIGNHILELDTCVRTDVDHQSNSRLSNLVAEHLDHLHYLNDILCLGIDNLNAVLTEHLLHKLFVPLYIFSLTPAPPLSMAVVTQNLAAVLNKVVDIDMQEMSNPRVSAVVALFLLSLVFLVITHGPLVHALAWVILNADNSVFKDGASEVLNAYTERREVVALGFEQPRESLEEALDTVVGSSSTSLESRSLGGESSSGSSSRDTSQSRSLSDQVEKINITDEEKEKLRLMEDVTPGGSVESNRPFLDLVLTSLDCTENDYIALLSLCLLYALANNKGVSPEWLEQVLNKSTKSSVKYSTVLIEHLLHIINLSSQPSCRIRLITLQITLSLLSRFAKSSSNDFILTEAQQIVLFSARNQAMTVLRNFYKSEDIFLDLFENEFTEMSKSILNVEFLCMDSTILLPPTGTPLTGINFERRLPCGEVERARRAIRVFFFLRKMCQEYMGEVEMLLPLTNLSNCVQVENVLDLNNSDLIACTVVTKDLIKLRRFLVIDTLQLILVEPDPKRLGWGISKFVGFLQDVEVVGDKDDSRCLHITVHRGGVSNNRTPILSAKFLFDDHIRCMAAKQRLTKGRSKARQKKMYQIAQLLEISGQMIEPPIYPVSGSVRTPSTSRVPREHRPLFSTANRVPGFAAALRRESMPSGGVSRVQMAPNRSIEGIRNENMQRRRRSSNTSSGSSSNGSSTARERSPGNRSPKRHESPRNSSPRSRDSSPRVPRPRSEEIPLEDFQHSRNSSPIPRASSSNTPSRSHTPLRTLGDQISISPRLTGGGHSSDIGNTLSPNGVGIMIAKEAANNSEETSFIAREEKEKRRGGVETV